MSKRFVYPSLTANQELFVATSGRFVRCLAATGGNGEVFIRFPKQEGMASEFEIPIYPGTWFQLPANERFTEFFLRAPVTLSSVEILVADGVYGDDRLSLGGAAIRVENVGSTLNELADGSSPVAVAAGTCVSIAADNPGRRQLLIYNDGASDVWLRSNNALQRSALPLVAGNFGFVEVTNEVFAYNDGAAPTSLLVSEI